MSSNPCTCAIEHMPDEHGHVACGQVTDDDHTLYGLCKCGHDKPLHQLVTDGPLVYYWCVECGCTCYGERVVASVLGLEDVT